MRHHNGGRQPNYDPNSFSERPNQSDELLYAPLEVHGRADIHAWTRHRADTDFVQASDLHRPMDEAATLAGEVEIGLIGGLRAEQHLGQQRQVRGIHGNRGPWRWNRA